MILMRLLASFLNQTFQKLNMNGDPVNASIATNHAADLYNWQDVTSSFIQSCSELQLGELCHDNVFRLFEVNMKQYREQKIEVLHLVFLDLFNDSIKTETLKIEVISLY